MEVSNLEQEIIVKFEADKTICPFCSGKLDVEIYDGSNFYACSKCSKDWLETNGIVDFDLSIIETAVTDNDSKALELYLELRKKEWEEMTLTAKLHSITPNNEYTEVINKLMS